MVRKVNPQAVTTIVGVLICVILGSISIWRTIVNENSINSRAQKILSKFTLEQKVGQLFLMDLSGLTLTDSDKAILKKYKLGNFILMGRNLGTIEETAAYSKSLQEYSMKEFGIPAFISIDQEAGSILRMYKNCTVFPGAMSLAATDSLDIAKNISKLMATELRAAGVNMNHAPTSDVNSNPKNPIIGDRSFGDNPENVSKFVDYYIQGHHEAGILTTSKHFPGHGATSVDSHKALPSIDHNMTQLLEIDIPPFQQAVKSGVDSIMVGHLITPIDNESACTQSKKCVDFARNQLKYDGILITDSMQMKAIKQEDLNESIATAIKSGIDLICDCGGDIVGTDPYYSVIAYIVEQVQKNIIPEKIIDQAALRIIKTKLAMLPATDPSSADVESDKKEAQRVAQLASTLAKDTNKLIPLDTTKKVAVIEGVTETTLITKTLSDILKNDIPNLQVYKFDYNTTLEDIAQAKDLASKVDTVVLVPNRAQYYRKQQWLIGNVTQANKNTISVSITDPYEVMAFDFPTHIIGYDRTQVTLNAAYNVLVGKANATGKVPFQY
ncbi:Glycosyl hydrolase family 3 N terminal domain containing protein [Trichomonas vaginalis G3]|uniref:Glycosyl hydrolase family 3 N terminal domain containing protein n=1 Tax=Trichomonas vaginalis (strain ATCC PRA-98 / G3) TaxID=412133 RepID=A2DGR7_TRIV3|nr:glycosyl hydrolase [Trichomonas vaginalis G3]EAY20454.1 Glycosyl hydrolase family 3 N terminal domain containing protein [Trichomonas vaginalis G3]KAI5490496.1 beta-hexosaminidase-related family [Trichomonas vaginalis G3]|eukprot:XP_001581440.1 glycosyl hydrolase [Trichomonas vaginalis G3]